MVRSFSISRELFKKQNSFLQMILAQDIPLKSKLLGKPKSAAFSLIFFRVALGLLSMGSSFGQEDKSTAFHPLQSSEWLGESNCVGTVIILASSFFFCYVTYVQSHNFIQVPQIHSWLQGTGRSGLCPIINIEFHPPPLLRQFNFGF